MNVLKRGGAIIGTAFCLILSYPQIEWWPLVFAAFVPLFWSVQNTSLRGTFGAFYLTGFLFFFGTLGWLVYVTWPGAVLLAAFLALYFALFGILLHWAQRLPLTVRAFVLAAGWSALEYVRAHLFSGFGWVTLGHSQYKNLWLIQIADITGVYGISFIVMLVNVSIFEGLRTRRWQLTQTLTVLICALCFLYGAVEMSAKPTRTVEIGVVQSNIPQDLKWEQELRASIVDKHIRLSQHFKKYPVALIVWPETSLPGVEDENIDLMARIRSTAITLHQPLIMGTIAKEGEKYFNSAFLISKTGETQGRYDKMHLVPFGEFLPLRPWLNWINHFVPLDDFTPGHEFKVFNLNDDPKLPFSILICFEDALSDLRRGFTKAGAQFFVNITNDAWFEDTKAPFLHMQAAILSTVEVKRALVRAANTGVSAFIDPYGRIIEVAHSDFGKKTFISATAQAPIALNDQMTFYTKYGDIFTFACFLGILWAFIISRRKSYA